MEVNSIVPIHGTTNRSNRDTVKWSDSCIACFDIDSPFWRRFGKNGSPYYRTTYPSCGNFPNAEHCNSIVPSSRHKSKRQDGKAVKTTFIFSSLYTQGQHIDLVGMKYPCPLPQKSRVLRRFFVLHKKVRQFLSFLKKFCPALLHPFWYSIRQYSIILSADTASEVRQLLSQKRR